MSDQSTGFRASPAAYDRFVGRYSGDLAAALCDRAGVGAGQRVLDVGCGPGALTAELAGRVGVGNVAAIDPSPPFLEACRARVPGVDAQVATAESLPFPDAGFDAALAQLVVNFMTDPVRGVGEMRRVTRPGGTVAACVWDYAGGMQLLRGFWDAAVAVDPDGAGPLDEARRMAISDATSLRDLWTRVGFTSIDVGALDVAAEYDGFDDLWAPYPAGVGPAGAYTVSLDETTRAALRDEYFRRLGAPTGPFRLTARAWCAVGTV
jgi:SAM-dependent methyltransferase